MPDETLPAVLAKIDQRLAWCLNELTASGGYQANAKALTDKPSSQQTVATVHAALEDTLASLSALRNGVDQLREAVKLVESVLGKGLSDLEIFDAWSRIALNGPGV